MHFKYFGRLDSDCILGVSCLAVFEPSERTNNIIIHKYIALKLPLPIRKVLSSSLETSAM